MADIRKISLAKAKHNARTFLRARRTRRIASIVAAVIGVYALLGFFALPALLRHIGQKQLSTQLNRPSSIARVAFNPFTLRVEIDGLHIAEKPTASAAFGAAGANSGDFIDIRRVVMRPSWSSLFHLAPIIKEVDVDTPNVTLVRYDADHFNFSDLIAKFSSSSGNSKQGNTARFAVSNIHVENGNIQFDDRLQHAQHRVDHLSIGVPFVATLASATDIFVTPALRAQVDGSPFSLEGRTKPFSESKESDIAFKVDGLDLARLASYLPASVPLSIKQGRLSTDLEVGFSIAGAAPTILVSGTADLADFAATDHGDTPLASFKALHVAVAHAEPLRGVYALDDVRLDGPSVSLSRDGKGVLNIAALLGSSGTPGPVKTTRAASTTDAGSGALAASAADVNAKAAAGQASSASSSASASAPASAPASTPASVSAASASTPLDLSIKHLSVDDGTVGFDDASVQPRTTLGLSKVAVTVDGFGTLSKTPASYTLKTSIDHGGNLDVSGDLSLPTKQTHLKLALDGLDLAPLQPYLPNAVPAKLTKGQLSVTLPIDVAWSNPMPSIDVGAGAVRLSALTLVPSEDVAPISLGSAVASIRKIDVNAHTAALDSIDVTGLTLAAKRLKDGAIDLSALAGSHADTGGKVPHVDAAASGASVTYVASAQDAASASRHSDVRPAQGTAPAWHYQIGKIALNDATASFADASTPRPVKLRLSPLQLTVLGVSDDLQKPLGLDGQFTVNGTGSLGVHGTVTPTPLKIALHVDSRQLDVSTFEPYFGDALNVSMASASLNADGDIAVNDGSGKPVRKGARAAVEADGGRSTTGAPSLVVRYNGDVALANVRMVDKGTNDAVAGWKLLGANGLKLAYDAHGTDVDVSKITFARFYGRVLLDAQGKLNLRDVVSSKSASDKAPKPAEKMETTHETSIKKPENASATPHPTTVRVGQIVLEDGRVTYSDNFVRPNYTANLVAINGTVGTFATHSSSPAPVDVAASLSGNGPVSIKGTVNPLLDKPALDLTASAHDVELTDLTPYSSKYVGYPITKGKLNVDLHYALADNNLTANNHLFIDQLTFGDPVDVPGASHLPVRLAVSLLKNARGEIDVNIPVSGSLSNPQFSIGSVVWHAILNLVERAVTAPFSLLTHAFGGGGGDAAALQYVAFEPGSASLTTAAQKKLDTIGVALASKPAIQLSLTAHVDPRVDAPSLRAAYLEDQVKLAKLKDQRGHAGSGNSDVSTVTVEANEYDKYLTAAYKAADFKKPRNFIGMTKTLPADEMEKALTDNAPVDADALKTLAQKRGMAVQAYLGKEIDVKRLSMTVAPVPTSTGPAAASDAAPASSSADSGQGRRRRGGANAGDDGTGSTRVDFALK